MSGPAATEQIIRLEMTVGHLEHELQQMHSVLLAVQADMQAVRDQISKLERRITSSSEPAEERSPVDERPPHY